MRLYRLLQSLVLSLTAGLDDDEGEALIRRAMEEAGMTEIEWKNLAELRTKLEANGVQPL